MAVTTDDFATLGKLLRERREQLGLTPDVVKSMGGPSRATTQKMENGEPVRRRLETTFRLEQIYGWSPGAINGFLDYGTIPHVVREPEPVKTIDLSTVPTADLEAELRRRRTR